MISPLASSIFVYCFNLDMDILEVLAILEVIDPDSAIIKKSVDSFEKSLEKVGKPLIFTLAIYTILHFYY